MIAKKFNFEGVFYIGRKIATKNLIIGKKVYGEKLYKMDNGEYRDWVPFRSKLGAAIKKGLKYFPIKNGSNILYLGVAEGTTASHLSDIIEKNGLLLGVDLSKRTMPKFIQLCEERENMVPVLADANKPEEYEEYLEGIKLDLLFQDISQKNQAKIFNKNAQKFLKKGQIGIIAIKGKSVSSTDSLKKVFEKEKKELEKEFEIIQELSLHPFEKDHLLCVMVKK